VPEPVLRELGPQDLDEAHEMGRLAFGGDPAETRPERPGRRQWGAYSGGRLVAKVAVHDYAQWWGGRAVPMGGLSGVAALPDVRGQGLVRRLTALATQAMGEAGHVVSALFPTAPGIYRAMGWELVGALEHTRVPLSALPPGPVEGVVVRPAVEADVPALQAAYDAWGRARSGLLTRTGPCFPKGTAGLLERDVVSVAVSGDEVLGYVAYARGRGMGADAELQVDEVVAASEPARLALLASLASWTSVIGAVQWRGPVDELERSCTALVPPPHERKPWMLRLLDPVAAVAARGWPVDGAADLDLTGTGPVRLTVSGGEGRLEPRRPDPDLPVVDPRGLAVLWAGAAGSRALVRSGLLDRPAPDLDALCGASPPVLLDYF